MPAKARILLALRPSLYAALFREAAQDRLNQLAELSWAGGEADISASQLARRIGGHDIVITGWGTPTFDADVLAAADGLRLIAHSAGTIKLLLPPPVFADGRRVTHAAAAMAIPVSEATLLLILLGLRQFHRIDRALREDSWAAAKAIPLGGELSGKRVGVIGAGYTGRAVMERLRVFGAEIWLYDPYLTEAQAAALGARKAELEPLMRQCPIVTLQAPSTDETYRMLAARQFGWLQDGALFINTARTHPIDEEALLAALQTGRFYAALDVFEQEPLPDASPFRALDNVILTPHIASHTVEARLRQGDIIVDEIASFLRAGELRYEVTKAMLDTMA